jgi:enoyl-[acyl-carrier protein] reductase I
VRDDEQLKRVIEEAAEALGGLDCLVHSVAFADLNDLRAPLDACSREGFQLAFDVSAYSLMRCVHWARPHLSESASVVTMTYLGARVAVPLYGLMGPVKAALEAEVRALASELGREGVRVNAVSAGPVKTLAAAGLPGFREKLNTLAEQTPLGRGVTQEEVAHAVCFLCSPLSSGVTGSTLYVDAGEHAVRP